MGRTAAVFPNFPALLFIGFLKSVILKIAAFLEQAILISFIKQDEMVKRRSTVSACFQVN